MSGSPSTAGIAMALNGTAPRDTASRDLSAAMYEFKVFNITITSLALCILTFTAIYCSLSYHNRRRQSQRVRVYESAVARSDEGDAVDIRSVRRARSLRSPLATLLRRQEATKDNSRIYYIYSNPLPVGQEEDGGPRGEPATPTPTLQDYAKDPSSGVVLDPPSFYMQL